MPEQAVDADVLALLPEGTDPPADIPAEIFDAALRTFLEQRRLDMRALAADLGMARATLYRRAGARDLLLGEVLWFLSRKAMERAILRADSGSGRERVVALVHGFMTDIAAQAPFLRLLEAEPEIALRVLTSKHGPVQSGTIRVVRRMLDQEEGRGTLRLNIDADTLAYVIVRIGESFLYADVIADNESDVGLASEVIERLLEGSTAPIGKR